MLGCASFDGELQDALRGVPIGIDDIPEGAITTEHRKALRDKRAIVEKCGDGETTRYRIEFPTGEIWWIDSNGRISGGVI
jgi:hypothetical protein